MLVSLKQPLLGTNLTLEQISTNRELAAKHQQVTYDNPSQLLCAIGLLKEARPLVSAQEVYSLRDDLAVAARGDAVVIHGGLCVEDTNDSIDQYAQGLSSVLYNLSGLLEKSTGKDSVIIGRMGGQLGKPRSNAYEMHNGTEVLTYRGPLVHGIAPDNRNPDPARLLHGYMYSADVMRAMKDNQKNGKIIHGSHESLLLPLEYGLMQQVGDAHYLGSAGYTWIGNRTRGLKDPHVQMARHTENAVGLKCGSDLTPDQLLELMEEINPHQIPGKLTLLFRMGAKDTCKNLLPLLQAAKHYEGSTLFGIDPMHGNGKVDPATKLKTRDMVDVKHETKEFVRACRLADVHPGVLHLEVSPYMVTECLGDGVTDITKDNRSKCDPCANPHQAAILTQQFGASSKASYKKQYLVA